MTYRSGGWLRNLATAPRWRAALSYVTGAHSMKVGYEGQFLSTDGGTLFPFPSLAYRFNNGVLNQLTMRLNPLLNNDRVRGTALYAQDQWKASGACRCKGASATTARRATTWRGRLAHRGLFPNGTTRSRPPPRGIDAYNDLSLRGGRRITSSATTRPLCG